MVNFISSNKDRIRWGFNMSEQTQDTNIQFVVGVLSASIKIGNAMLVHMKGVRIPTRPRPKHSTPDA